LDDEDLVALTRAGDLESASTLPVAATTTPAAAAWSADAATLATQQQGIPWWCGCHSRLSSWRYCFSSFAGVKPELIIATRSTPSDPIIKTRR